MNVMLFCVWSLIVDKTLNSFHFIGMAGYNPITVQKFDVFDELADVLETMLVGVNSVLTELLDFYDSCIAEQLSDTVNLQPFRDLIQRLGKSIKALYRLRSVSFTYIWFLPCYHDPMRYM